MTNRILIFQWAGSAYDSLRGLLQLAAAEIETEGLNVEYLTVEDQDCQKRLNELLTRNDIVCAIGMSGVGADLRLADGRLLWEAARIPFYNWNCDHPCYFPSRHAIRSNYLCHGYVFPDHARYTLTHLNPNGAVFSAHLGIPNREIFGPGFAPRENRNGRILFTKSSADTNQIEARWQAQTPLIRFLLFAAAEELLLANTRDFLPTLQRIAEQRGVFLHGNSMLALQLIREIDSYVRFRRTRFVAEALRDFPIDIYGSGWEDFARDTDKIKVHGPLPWLQTLQLLPDYLGCLSLNPLVDESVHDRSFFALAAGVPPIADANAFSRTHFAELTGLTFSFDRDSIQAAAAAVLENPQLCIETTEKVWQRAQNEFSLRQSVRQIIHQLALTPLNARCAP